MRIACALPIAVQQTDSCLALIGEAGREVGYVGHSMGTETYIKRSV